MKISPCSDRPILNPCSLEGFTYQIDPYIGCGHLCHYCYVLDQAETDWSEEILIHVNISTQLDKEIEQVQNQQIYIGWHTDPYQPCEAEYLQTRQVLELLVERNISVSILTKSDLVLRDLDVLKAMKNPEVSVSVAFQNERDRTLFEANTTNTEARIIALHKLRDHGIKTSALICPVIPYISDAIRLLEMLEPCTDVIWIYGLNAGDRASRGWQNVQEILTRDFPDIKDQIIRVVTDKEHPTGQNSGRNYIKFNRI